MNKFICEIKNIFRNCCRKIIILKFERFLFDGKQVLQAKYLFLKVLLFNVNIPKFDMQEKLL